ncbi:hypothetical protein BU14_1686s0001, partial [Porphyra umbilicalis]
PPPSPMAAGPAPPSCPSKPPPSTPGPPLPAAAPSPSASLPSPRAAATHTNGRPGAPLDGGGRAHGRRCRPPRRPGGPTVTTAGRATPGGRRIGCRAATAAASRKACMVPPLAPQTDGKAGAGASEKRKQPPSGRTSTQTGEAQERGTEDPQPQRARRRGGGARPRSARSRRRTGATRCLQRRPPRGGPDAATPGENKIGHGRGGERAQARRGAGLRPRWLAVDAGCRDAVDSTESVVERSGPLSDSTAFSPTEDHEKRRQERSDSVHFWLPEELSLVLPIDGCDTHLRAQPSTGRALLLML